LSSGIDKSWKLHAILYLNSQQATTQAYGMNMHNITFHRAPLKHSGVANWGTGYGHNFTEEVIRRGKRQNGDKMSLADLLVNGRHIGLWWNCNPVPQLATPLCINGARWKVMIWFQAPIRSQNSEILPSLQRRGGSKFQFNVLKIILKQKKRTKWV